MMEILCKDYLFRIIIIMEFHQIASKQIKIDNIQESTSSNIHENRTEFQTKDLQKELEIISRYLNLDLNIHHLFQNSEIKSTNYSETETNHQNQVADTVTPKKQKSPFHNFQKHLITSIKKFMHLSSKKLSIYPHGQVAYHIWMAFLDCNVSNKKVLNLMFGSYNPDNILKQADSKDFSSFKRVFSYYSIDEIESGQRLLRESIVTQGKTLSKQFLKSNSNIKNIDIFYQYFLNFLAELQNGPLSRRITNLRKEKCNNPT